MKACCDGELFNLSWDQSRPFEMQIFFDKAQSLFVAPTDDIKHVKHCIEGKTGIPAGLQRLIYSGRELDDDQSVYGSGLEASSTLHLVFRLRGGKGGFGSLLRSAGRAALTDNFDACRDLSGRRLRHVNADKKLAEWASQARERELEKVAAKHIRDQERAAQQEAEQQVDLDDVKVAQEAALANVMSAVESGLALAPAKRKSDAAPPSAKRQRASGHMLDLDCDLSSDSDAEVDGTEPGPSDVNKVAAEAQAQPAANAEHPSGSNSSGSDQEALGSSLPPMHPAQEDARSVEDSTAPPSALTGASAAQMSVVDSALHTAGDSTELTVVASTAAIDLQTASPARAASTQATLTSKKRAWEPVDLSKYSSAQELETLGLEYLKAELQRHGLKAGGSLAERAARLFLLSHTPIEKIDMKQLAKPAQK